MSPTAGLAVTRQGIRRFLLEAQDLLGDHHYRPAAVATSGQVLREIHRLEAVQLDPVAAVERNQHLVLAARVPGYTPALTDGGISRGPEPRSPLIPSTSSRTWGGSWSAAGRGWSGTLIFPSAWYPWNGSAGRARSTRRRRTRRS